MTWAATAAAFVAMATAAVSYGSGQRQLYASSKAAHDSQVIQNQQIEEQRKQIAQQSANDKTERMRAQQQETGKLRVITGESGALGFTADRLLQDSEFQLGSDIATIEANKVSAMKQTSRDALSIYSQNTSRVNEAANWAPTLLGTGLQIGAIGAGHWVRTLASKDKEQTESVQ